MKRILLSMAMVGGLLCGGLLTSTAQAHGPHHSHCPPRYSYGYGANTGYSPYNNYRAPFAPYSAGYVGGCQPYQAWRPHHGYNQQPRLGLYLGF